MSNVRRVSITLQDDGTWLLVVKPERGSSYTERFGRLRTAVELLPRILERFWDTTSPMPEEYRECEGSE